MIFNNLLLEDKIQVQLKNFFVIARATSAPPWRHSHPTVGHFRHLAHTRNLKNRIYVACSTLVTIMVENPIQRTSHVAVAASACIADRSEPSCHPNLLPELTKQILHCLFYFLVFSDLKVVVGDSVPTNI